MSRLNRPAVCASFVFCLVLVALYFGSSANQSQAGDGNRKGGLPARVETLEDALSLVFSELDSQASLVNAINFDLNAKIDALELRVIALEGPDGDPIP